MSDFARQWAATAPEKRPDLPVKHGHEWAEGDPYIYERDEQGILRKIPGECGIIFPPKEEKI